MKLFLSILLLAVAAPAQTGPAWDTPKLPKRLQGIGIDQRLGSQIPLDVPFLDEGGNSVTLGQLAAGRPVVLALVYYECTMLCNQILNGVVHGLRPLSLKPGRDFDVVAISINPAEGPQLAAAKRDHYVRSYSRTASTQGWHFLTGTDASIHQVAEAAGFRYRYDPATKIFLHASGVMVLTSERRVSRYFYGVEYEPKDLKLGLVEASGNRIGSLADQILLFCYHYDPSQGKYSATVINVLRAGAVGTMLVLGVVLGLFWRKEWHGGGTRGRREVREP